MVGPPDSPLIREVARYPRQMLLRTCNPCQEEPELRVLSVDTHSGNFFSPHCRDSLWRRWSCCTLKAEPLSFKFTFKLATSRLTLSRVATYSVHTLGEVWLVSSHTWPGQLQSRLNSVVAMGWLPPRTSLEVGRLFVYHSSCYKLLNKVFARKRYPPQQQLKSENCSALALWKQVHRVDDAPGSHTKHICQPHRNIARSPRTACARDTGIVIL